MLPWTARQRGVLIGSILLLCGWLGVRLALNRQSIADPQPPAGANAEHLATRVDPNTADWATLAILPQLGEKRAKAIVAFREAHEKANPGTPAFAKEQDLLQVPGIGAATIETLRPHLAFPPTTAPVDR
jgi:DNA uptake protein ComE-like DNA-binding protein